jgi:hypothetical protein
MQHETIDERSDSMLPDSASEWRMTCTFSSIFNWNVILCEELIEKVFRWAAFLTTS